MSLLTPEHLLARYIRTALCSSLSVKFTCIYTYIHTFSYTYIYIHIYIYFLRSLIPYVPWSLSCNRRVYGIKDVNDCSLCNCVLQYRCFQSTASLCRERHKVTVQLCRKEHDSLTTDSNPNPQKTPLTRSQECHHHSWEPSSRSQENYTDTTLEPTAPSPFYLLFQCVCSRLTHCGVCKLVWWRVYCF